MLLQATVWLLSRDSRDSIDWLFDCLLLFLFFLLELVIFVDLPGFTACIWFQWSMPFRRIARIAFELEGVAVSRSALIT